MMTKLGYGMLNVAYNQNTDLQILIVTRLKLFDSHPLQSVLILGVHELKYFRVRALACNRQSTESCQYIYRYTIIYIHIQDTIHIAFTVNKIQYIIEKKNLLSKIKFWFYQMTNYELFSTRTNKCISFLLL